jgi:hypothetical protein
MKSWLVSHESKMNQEMLAKVSLMEQETRIRIEKEAVQVIANQKLLSEAFEKDLNGQVEAVIASVKNVRTPENLKETYSEVLKLKTMLVVSF